MHVPPCKFVDTPIIDEYPLTIECNVVEMHVVSKVVNVQADESILDVQDKVDFNKQQPISFDSVSRSYRPLGII